MENLGTLTTTLTEWIVNIGGTVNDLPGVAAFGLGLFTWFMAEQILRRLVSGLRWIILIGALAGLGLTAPYMLSLVFERGGDVEAVVGEE
jgi:uncharacterized membrane protein YjdF